MTILPDLQETEATHPPTPRIISLNNKLIVWFVFAAPCVNDVQQAIEHIYPLVHPFRKERTKEDELLMQQKAQGKKRKAAALIESEPESDAQDSEESCE